MSCQPVQVHLWRYTTFPGGKTICGRKGANLPEKYWERDQRRAGFDSLLPAGSMWCPKCVAEKQGVCS